jgi:putative DNA primase/helicase
MNAQSKMSKRTVVMRRPAHPLRYDMGMAARFLHGLDPDADAFTFQTRDDRGHNPELSYVLHGRLETCARRLQVLNHYGAGVFVTVNETNGRGRALQQIKRVRGVWQRNSGQGQPLPLKPHLVVASHPYQYESYWRVAGLTVAQARAIQETLVTYYGSDQAAQDLTGALRVPGFYHWQDEPHWVRLIHAACDALYPAAVLMNAFPVIAFPNQSSERTKRDAIAPGCPVFPPRW